MGDLSSMYNTVCARTGWYIRDLVFNVPCVKRYEQHDVKARAEIIK